MKTKLSVNINKVALIRNGRGGNLPDVVKFSLDCEEYGADGITLHPRPDQRHAKYSDVRSLKEVVKTELNVEGYPSKKFLEVVLANKPHQCTLVPDPPGILTSNEGWNTIEHKSFLEEVVGRLKEAGIRTSLFLDPDINLLHGAKAVGTDRIELYTGNYANNFFIDKEKAIEPHIEVSQEAAKLKIGLNAGHDLNLDNLAFYAQNVVHLAEVSIGHALVSDALYYGIQNTIGMYQKQLLY